MDRIKTRCLCGSISEQVDLRQLSGISLCHCNTCRYSSGLLCTSYIPVQGYPLSEQLRPYSISARTTTYFCITCGCQVARARETQSGQRDWEVASGTIIDSTTTSGPLYDHHGHVQDTKDGGISRWISFWRGGDFQTLIKSKKETKMPCAKILPASCLCGKVRFEVTRPGPESRQPSRWLPDLMYPDKTTSGEIKKNANDVKWWIPGDHYKYLAGTCVCRSCRQSSGFEIQTWAFVPRTNILFLVPGTGPGEFTRLPLDFATLPQGILQTYNSSPNVCRDFCGICGASVFWREKGKPDVIDISIGLLRAPEGARAESWLNWWTERVSFAEDVSFGRAGWVARSASTLVQALENGLKTA